MSNLLTIHSIDVLLFQKLKFREHTVLLFLKKLLFLLEKLVGSQPSECHV